MSGKKGRSGGHNRRSAADHRLRGTFRKDRHTAPAAPPVQRPAPAHLSESAREVWDEIVHRYAATSDLLQLELLSIHTALHRSLHGVMKTAAAAPRDPNRPPSDSGQLLRSMRLEAALCRAIAATLRLVEEPELQRDEFSEFLD